MKSIKVKFTRDSKLFCQRIHKGEALATITYANGKCEIHRGGFQHTIYNVDELLATMRPLDEFITEITFVASNNLGTQNKLDLKIIGILGEHIKWEAENDERDDVPKEVYKPIKKVETVIRKAEIAG